MSKKFLSGIFSLALLAAILTSFGIAQAQVCGDCDVVKSAGLCMGKAVNSPCGKDRFCVNLRASGCPLGISACGCSPLSGASPHSQEPNPILRQNKPLDSGNMPGNQNTITPAAKTRMP